MSKVEPFVLISAERESIPNKPGSILPKYTVQYPLIAITSRYSAEKYYVRSCFASYYEDIIALFEKRSYLITVEGSSGVGKSMFCYYFFQRFRREFPKRRVSTASFDDFGTMEGCIYFEPGSESGIVEKGKRPFGGDYELNLYDGQASCPSNCGQIIAFMRSNREWSDEARKHHGHVNLPLPPWSFGELEEACAELGGMEICRDELRARFEFFGGVARHCFETDVKRVNDAVEELLTLAKSISSIDQVRSGMCEFTENPWKDFVFLQTPTQLRYTKFAYPSSTRDFASKQLRKLILGRIDEEGMKTRRFDDFKPRLKQYVRTKPYPDFFVSNGFEKSLVSLDSEHHLEIACKLEPGMFRPTPISFPSIDGYAYKDDVLYLFQLVMDEEILPILPHGIITVVSMCGLIDKVLKNEIRLKFVFVAFTPIKRDPLTKQPVVKREVNMDSPVHHIAGIGYLNQAKFISKGILTIAALAESRDIDHDVGLDGIFSELSQRESWQSILDAMPQYQTAFE